MKRRISYLSYSFWTVMVVTAPSPGRLRKNILCVDDAGVNQNVPLLILSLSADRLGYLRWRESRAPEETEDTALTTTITLLRAERGKDIPHKYTERKMFRAKCFFLRSQGNQFSEESLQNTSIYKKKHHSRISKSH